MCRETLFRGVIDQLRATEGKRTRKTNVEKKEIELTAIEGKPRCRKIRDGQKYIKVEVLKDLDLITTAMMKKAKRGGTAPLRLLWELGKLHQDATTTKKRREPSLSGLLMKELRSLEAVKKQKPPLS